MSDKSNLFLIIFMVLVLVATYFWYTQFREPDLTANLSASSENQFIGREFVILASRLRAITIDTDFFSDERFASLKDFTPIIELPEKTGRDNPFAPVGQ